MNSTLGRDNSQRNLTAFSPFSRRSLDRSARANIIASIREANSEWAPLQIGIPAALRSALNSTTVAANQRAHASNVAGIVWLMSAHDTVDGSATPAREWVLLRPHDSDEPNMQAITTIVLRNVLGRLSIAAARSGDVILIA
jgi:hypothetical protein